MRAQDIFMICQERVEQYQALSSRIPAIRADACARDGPARVGNHMAEYIADFELCGRRVLARKDRYQVFRLYYVEGRKPREVMKRLRVKEGTFWYWTEEIRRAVGKELARTGLFPPSQYRKR